MINPTINILHIHVLQLGIRTGQITKTIETHTNLCSLRLKPTESRRSVGGKSTTVVGC